MSNQIFNSILERIKVEPSEKNVFDLIQYARNGMTYSEIGTLARLYANSGAQFEYPSQKTISDIPSTGGPSSLSTIIAPLFLKSFGYLVPKLGVPGRPAGGVDILSQIPGYNINPKPNELKNWLDLSSYAHFIGGDHFAPLDRKVFDLRKKYNAVAITPLVIASILSKKIVMNLTKTGLDVRVSPFGNFGKTWEEARINSACFVRVASIVGISAKCIITNGEIPYQPYIGRGEALLALLKIFEERIEHHSLINHLNDCYKMAATVANIEDVKNPKIEDFKRLFSENISIQGGSYGSFRNKAIQVEKEHLFTIKATESGHLKINMEAIRKAIVNVQTSEFSDKNVLPDPCGIIFKIMLNELVNKGESIATFRCSEKHVKPFQKELEQSFSMEKERFVERQFEVIN